MLKSDKIWYVHLVVNCVRLRTFWTPLVATVQQKEVGLECTKWASTPPQLFASALIYFAIAVDLFVSSWVRHQHHCSTIVIHLEMLLAGTWRAVASAHPWERDSIVRHIKLYAEASIYMCPTFPGALARNNLRFGSQQDVRTFHLFRTFIVL